MTNVTVDVEANVARAKANQRARYSSELFEWAIKRAGGTEVWTDDQERYTYVYLTCPFAAKYSNGEQDYVLEQRDGEVVMFTYTDINSGLLVTCDVFEFFKKHFPRYSNEEVEEILLLKLQSIEAENEIRKIEWINLLFRMPAVNTPLFTTSKHDEVLVPF